MDPLHDSFPSTATIGRVPIVLKSHSSIALKVLNDKINWIDFRVGYSSKVNELLLVDKFLFGKCCTIFVLLDRLSVESLSSAHILDDNTGGLAVLFLSLECAKILIVLLGFLTVGIGLMFDHLVHHVSDLADLWPTNILPLLLR